MQVFFGAVTAYHKYESRPGNDLGLLEGTGQTNGLTYSFSAFGQNNQTIVALSRGQNKSGWGPPPEHIQFEIDAQNPETGSLRIVPKTPGRYDNPAEVSPRGFKNPDERDALAQDARQIAIKRKQAHQLFTLA